MCQDSGFNVKATFDERLVCLQLLGGCSKDWPAAALRALAEVRETGPHAGLLLDCSSWEDTCESGVFEQIAKVYREEFPVDFPIAIHCRENMMERAGAMSGRLAERGRASRVFDRETDALIWLDRVAPELDDTEADSLLEFG